MAGRRIQNRLLRILPVVLVPAIMLGVTSCSDIAEIIESELDEEMHTKPDDDMMEDETERTNGGTTYETFQPTGTYTTAPFETMDIDIDFVEDVYIYSVWYDAVQDNPVDYDRVESKDAFALKGVFYFNTPLTTVFEARLLRDDEVILTKTITLKDNVTAECDFSAGLEGWGVFEAGDYTVELYFDGEYVGATDKLEVY